MRTLLNLKRTELTHARGYAVLFNLNISYSMAKKKVQNMENFTKLGFVRLWGVFLSWLSKFIVPLQEGDKSSSTYLPNKVFRL